MGSTGEVLTKEQEEAYNRRLNEARKAKEEGNNAFNSGKLPEASFSYKKGCLFLAEYVPGGMETTTGGADLQDLLIKRQLATRRCQLSEEQVADVMALYASLQNNLALVNKSRKRYAEGVKCATIVLSLHGYENNRKALLRRAQCYLELGDCDAADTDVKTLESFRGEDQTPDKEVESLRRDIVNKKKVELQVEKNMCKKMFGVKK